MSKKTLLLRADDLASSHSANLAIAQAVKNGLIKNVSVMAVGPFLNEAAELLSGNENLCFGMHATLNAEWDKVKWRPLTKLTQDSGLVDDQGYFLSDPSLFIQTKPKIEVILKEFDAQLNLLISKGFKIRYVDSHMMPETVIEGLDEAMGHWIKEKGLIDHAYYYYGEPLFEPLMTLGSLTRTLRTLTPGQHFMVVHLSLDTEEMRQIGNKNVPGNLVASARQKETTVMSHKLLPLIFKLLNCKTVSYEQALPGERINFK